MTIVLTIRTSRIGMDSGNLTRSVGQKIGSQRPALENAD